MSEYQNTHDHDDTPRLEPWLVVMMLSLVPAAAAPMFHEFLVPLVVAAGALFITALVMLRRQTIRRERRRISESPR